MIFVAGAKLFDRGAVQHTDIGGRAGDVCIPLEEGNWGSLCVSIFTLEHETWKLEQGSLHLDLKNNFDSSPPMKSIHNFQIFVIFGFSDVCSVEPYLCSALPALSNAPSMNMITELT